MRIRILDRILVALAGLLLVAACAGLVAQVFFSKDIVGLVTNLLTPETTTGKIVAGVCAGVLLLLGLYCLLMLFRHRRRKDKFILQKLESGDLAISLKTLEAMVQKCVEQHSEIKTESIHLENQRDGLLIRIRGTVAGGISIPLTADTLQKQVKQYVTACSGVEVKGIRIQIESSGADAKDAPFAIEPPVSNLLSKGGDAEKAPEPDPSDIPEVPAEVQNESAPEPEKPIPGEEAAAVAAMAAAESLMNDLDTEDDRPIHQRLFSTQEEPCIMPLAPEKLNEDGGENAETDKAETAAPNQEKNTAEPAEVQDAAETDMLKGEEDT